jgi:OOP family OmpA-OmpF porin
MIIVTGHTDSVGSAIYNEKLSKRRALSAKKFLVSKGLPSDRIVTNGKGEQQPVASNKTSAGRAKNRRVDIEVVGKRTK